MQSIRLCESSNVLKIRAISTYPFSWLYEYFEAYAENEEDLTTNFDHHWN